MIVLTSFGRVRLRSFGVRDLDVLGLDLAQFIKVFSEGVMLANLTGDEQLGSLVDRVIRAAAESPLPDVIPLPDLGPLVEALWQVNRFDLLGKVIALHPQAVMLLHRAQGPQ